MQRYLVSLTAIGSVLLLWAGVAGAHCELPCGIYDDQMRVQMIMEDILTVEKSMNQIMQLEKQSPINYNQLVRWISDKETHADKIQHVVSQYFMTQRIKPDQKGYSERLAVLHQMLIAAMKCKQTTDLEHVAALRTLLKKFETLYFEDDHKK